MKNNINKVTMNFFRRTKFSNASNFSLSIDEKSKLIYMVLAGIPLPIIMLEELGENEYFVLSGAEIVSTIQEFMNERFALNAFKVLKKFVSESVEGKTFSEFSEELKDDFLDTEMVISVFRHPLNEEERNAVLTVISHTPASSTESTSVEVEKKSEPKTTAINPELKEAHGLSGIEEQLENVLNHPFFRKVNINQLNSDIVVSLFMVSENGAVSDLSGAKIANFKSQLTELPNYKDVADYLDKAYTEKTTYLKKAHLPMVYVCAQKALKSNLPPEKFKEVIDAFFASNNEEYKKAGDNGTASKANVNTRIRLMVEFFNNNI